MIEGDLQQLAHWIGSESPAQGAFRGVSIDSRAIEPGMVFCALPGTRVDGHDFLAAAAERGASAAVVERLVPGVEIQQLPVANCERALGLAAAAWRQRCPARVLGLTGSNGKTATKNALAAILAELGPVLATEGNLNNQIGLPLMLCRLGAQAYAVLEMGAGAPGDIEYLAELAQPDLGLITNIGPAHLERLGSLDAVAETKGALYRSLPLEGLAVVPADDAYCERLRFLAAGRRTVSFGWTEQADVRVQSYQADSSGSRFELLLPDAAIAIHLALPGRHAVSNALAAAAACWALGVPAQAIRNGLQALRPIAGRLQPWRSRAGWEIWDDSYNANPASVRAGVEAALEAAPGPVWLVLGAMRELGPDSARWHAEVGRCARDSGIQRIYTLGPETMPAAASYGAGAHAFSDLHALVEALTDGLQSGVRVLVKGSRGAAMERVVAALQTYAARQEGVQC